MRVANLSGRLVIVTPDGARALDVEHASGGSFGPHAQDAYERWDEFAGWATGIDLAPAAPFAVENLGPPSPAPRQVFAIGANYTEHAAESGLPVPDAPSVVFTKWPSCLTGPISEVVLPAGGHTDWEVELVAIIGRRAYQVAEAEAWRHVAGVTVGQDLSERITQLTGPAPQFGLGKSLPGFGPTGPWLVTPDELDRPDDLELGCRINGELMQRSRTRDLIFSVPALVAQLSQVVPLLPGDLLFTGTPAGVGLGHRPPRWLAPGDELVSYVTGIGELRQRFVAAHPRPGQR